MHACPVNLNQCLTSAIPFTYHPMSTPDKLYDEAIELQQAGKLDEAVTRLESLAQSHPDFALAHARTERVL